MTGKFRPKPATTRYPGGVRVDVLGDGSQTWLHSGRAYPPGTVGAHLSHRHPSVG
jgi:hypothetical protein